MSSAEKGIIVKVVKDLLHVAESDVEKDAAKAAAKDSENVAAKDAAAAAAKKPENAADLIKNGQEYKGSGGRGGSNLPQQGGPPDGTLFKRDPQTGQITNYTTYDANGNAVKRVDLTGRPHAGIPTPHVVHYDTNVNPKTGQVFVRPQKMVRPATPEEIP